jgi:hypothetical protein
VDGGSNFVLAKNSQIYDNRLPNSNSQRLYIIDKAKLLGINIKNITKDINEFDINERF